MTKATPIEVTAKADINSTFSTKRRKDELNYTDIRLRIPLGDDRHLFNDLQDLDGEHLSVTLQLAELPWEEPADAQQPDMGDE